MPVFSKANLKKRYEFLIKESDYRHLEYSGDQRSHFIWKEYVYERLRDAVSQAVVFFIEQNPAPSPETDCYLRPASMPYKNMIVVFTDQLGNLTNSLHYLNFHQVHLWDTTVFDDVSNYRMESLLHWVEANDDGSFPVGTGTKGSFYAPAGSQMGYKEIDISDAVFSLFENLSSQRDPYMPVTNKNKKTREGKTGNLTKFLRIKAGQTMNVSTGESRDYQPRREHDVRGHWRIFSNGNKTWVRSHKRGDGTLGTIKKTYILEAAE